MLKQNYVKVSGLEIRNGVDGCKNE